MTRESGLAVGRPNGESDPALVRVGRSFTVNWAFFNGNPQCCSYEVYDRHNRLVYVGITGDFAARWTSHLKSSWWARSVDIFCVLLRGYTSRHDARKYEAAMIDQFKPPCNTKPELKYLRFAQIEGMPTDILTAELWPARKF